VCAAALAGALGAGRARAADDPAKLEQAKTDFKAGAQAYDMGRFAAAIQAFRQAYDLVPRPAILFSLAQAERKAWFVDKHVDDLKHAIEHYHAYLDQVPTGGRRGDAADALAELEPLAARASPSEPAPAAPAQAKTRLMVTSSTAGAYASLDGGPAAEVPLVDDVTPGRHHVRVWATGYFDEERDALAAAGSLAAIDVPLRDRPARLSVETDATATLSVDGRAVATTPLARPVELPAGPHVVTVTASGSRVFTRELKLARGEETKLPVKLERTTQRTAAWAVLAGGGVALLAGGAFTVVALVEQSRAQSVLDAQARGNVQQSDLDTYRSASDARDRWRSAAIASFGAALGLVAIGGALYLFDQPGIPAAPSAVEAPPREPEPKKPDRMEMKLVPWVAPGGAGVTLGGRM
jgi:hypothetical protein